jgi:HD-GYP domain-containing protein (c-di-GMP phosphodiesterase class II)
MAHVLFLAKISKRFPQVEYQINALRMRSPSTHSHCLGVVQAAYYVGHALGYHENNMETLGIAGLLHDLGKTNLEGKIIEGQGQLSEQEWEEMKQHPFLGYSYIVNPQEDNVPRLVKLPESVEKMEYKKALDVAEVILGHHEHGKERYPVDPYAKDFNPSERRHIIPLIYQMSQIICACDILDALVTFRVYKQELDYTQALAQLADDFRGDKRIIEIITRSKDIAKLYCQFR